MNENTTMDKIELAKWLHDNYEEVAKEQNWNTQENCKVEFDTLPDANKRTMIEIADRLLNFNLLRLYFVSSSFSAEKIKEAYTDGFSDSRYDFDAENYHQH